MGRRPSSQGSDVTLIGVEARPGERGARLEGAFPGTWWAGWSWTGEGIAVGELLGRATLVVRGVVGMGTLPPAVGRSSGRAPLEVSGSSRQAVPEEEEVVGSMGSCGGRRLDVVGAMGQAHLIDIGAV